MWDPAVTDLRPFDTERAPAEPLPLFARWLAEAAAAGQPEPHTMSLATADADGLPDVRIVMLHGADERGWSFATHAHSRKGGHLAARRYAALAFYWPVLGRQVRVRGRVTAAPPEEARADLHARSTGALAAALTGRQSAVLPSPEELTRASEAAWDQARRAPDTPAPLLDPLPPRPGRGGVLPGRPRPPPRPAAVPPGGSGVGAGAAVAVRGPAGVT
ncbi:Pyridoxine/pyridoxamine 5'-phosphate oxidase [Streptomyces griseoloalbus]